MAKGITINNTFYLPEDIEDICSGIIKNKQVLEWEKSVFAFILEWYNNEDYFLARTSGSTGKPKTIRIKKQFAIASAKATLKYFSLNKGDVAWLCLPADYIAGKMMIVRAIEGELNLLLSEPKEQPEIKAEKIDFCAMIPNQVFSMISDQEKSKTLYRIDKLLIGGSTISSSLERNIVSNKEINAWHSFGMTETITHVGLRKIQKKESFFKPLPGVTFSLNPDSRLIINAPKIGVDIHITNDIAEINDKGYINILGRYDNIIISGGKKHHPEILENIIKSNIDKEFFIGSLPDDKLGEKIILFLEGNINESEKQVILNTIALKLDKHQRPKEIHCIDFFVRTKSGKINRKLTIGKSNK